MERELIDKQDGKEPDEIKEEEEKEELPEGEEDEKI